MVVGVPRITEGSYTMPTALFLGNARMVARHLNGSRELKKHDTVCSGWRVHNPKLGTRYTMEALSYILQQAHHKTDGSHSHSVSVPAP
jgi:hypothetical protein